MIAEKQICIIMKVVNKGTNLSFPSAMFGLMAL